MGQGGIHAREEKDRQTFSARKAQEMGDKGKKDKDKKLKQQAKKKEQDAKAKHDKNHKARTHV
jgi:hypothetical protein